MAMTDLALELVEVDEHMTAPVIELGGRPVERDDAREVVVSAKNLTHGFGGTTVIDGVDFSVREGDFVSIIGPSGCGKTTALNLVAGLEPIQRGDVRLFGEAPRAGRPDVSMAFARDALMPWRTAVDNVALPLELQGVGRAERRERAGDLLSRVGLGSYLGAYRGELSQGMRQRVALARALVVQPRLLMLDEPFAALDSQTRVLVQAELLDMLAGQETPVTTIMVTHDLAEAVALSDAIIAFSPRPAKIRAEYRINLPRPRDAMKVRSEDAFHEAYDTIWRSLADDMIAASGLK